MELYLYRNIFTPSSTISDLFFGGDYECHMLEDPDREIDSKMPLSVIMGTKQYGTTAIPYGRYKIVIDRSTRLSLKESEKQGHPVDVFTPHLLDVPGFEGIRIHIANFAIDVKGCLAPGITYSKDAVWNSHTAYANVLHKIQSAVDRNEEVFITIQNKSLKQT